MAFQTMRHCVCTATLILLIAASLSSAKRPNIVFIVADDMGYADAGCYGQTKIQTPNIDRLASQGMRFTQCYAGSAVCAPSRSVLMTGLHTGHTRVRGNFGRHGIVGLGGGKGRVPLLDEDVTVAEVLHNAGYRTGVTGKWGLGEPGTNGTPNKQGFDSWFGFLNQRRAHNHYPEYLWLNENKFDLTGNLSDQEQLYSHDLFTGYALNFIRENQRKPFFLYVPYTIPHARFQVPDLGIYKDKDWPTDAKAYAAMISRMDADVGRIVSLLEELKIDERTMVFFCSDNGAADRYDDLFDSSGPLRGRKRDMYEGGLRTPMIVQWPEKIEAGTTSDLVWSFADVLPTLAEAAVAEAPDGLDGQSVLPTILGKEQDLANRFLYWEFHEKKFHQASRWRHWKAVRSGVSSPIELYDLSKDPGETTNVAETNPETIAKFETYFATARVESENWPVGEEANRPLPKERIKSAAQSSLRLIEKSSGEYLNHRTCFSCHHQAMPVLTLTKAKQFGFSVDDDNLKAQTHHIVNHLKRGRENYLKGIGQGGQVDAAGYALWALAEAEWKPDETTAVVAEYLLKRDKKRDYWRTTSNRPPTSASDFTATAVALFGLTHFATDKQSDRFHEKLRRLPHWVLEEHSTDTEDKVFRLNTLDYLRLGLGEDAEETRSKIETAIARIATELVATQRSDGGFAQNEELESDAYATGTVLVSVHDAAGIKVSDPVYQAGLRFLLRQQLKDGSWHVRSRSKPFQVYFESGFPHGKDQFISISATCWATMALLNAN